MNDDDDSCVGCPIRTLAILVCSHSIHRKIYLKWRLKYNDWTVRFTDSGTYDANADMYK